MIPNKFTLTGALGIKAGLNLESITMDFASIPEDAVTVAIRGDNGMGKSTILNLGLTPFRLPPHVGDIYSHFSEKGARELEFEHDGVFYKSSISISQSKKTKSMSAMLHYFNNGEWVPVVTTDNTMSDGKNGTYDKCLEHVLGPKSIYFMSAFKCQNAKPLADHDDPKALMRDLLSLDEPDRLSVKSNEIAKHLKQQLESKRTEVDEIQSNRDLLIEYINDHKKLSETLPELQNKKQLKVDAVNDATTAYENARTSNNDDVEIKKNHDALKQQKQTIETDHTAETKRTNGQIDMLEKRLKNSKILLSTAKDIETAEQQIPILETQLESLSTSLSVHRASLTKLNQLRSDMRNQRTECNHIAEAGKALTLNFAGLEKRAEFVEQVPCGGVPPYNTCPALQEAIKAKQSLPDQQKIIISSREKWKERDEAANGLLSEISLLGDIEQAIFETEEMVSQTNINLTNFRMTASKRPALDQAKLIITETDEELRKLTIAKSEYLGVYSQRIKAANDAILLLPPINENDRLKHAGEQLKTTEADFTAAALEMDRCINDIANIESTQNTIKQKLNNSDELLQNVDRISKELARWKLLTMALKGVIDLSIEDAGPAIAAIANKLLNDAYGPRFTLNIVTQKTQNNGVLKETFDISVIDAQSEIESSIVKKSGGEMVWLDKAITDAVGLHHKEAANIDYECMFADEAEDGLTDERKEQLYIMDRSMLKIGGYKRKFFISHNPSAWENADHVIDLADFRH